MMANATSEDLCGCLRRIATLLEKGEPVEAAKVVAEMHQLLPRLPQEMAEAELDDARNLLARCEALEGDLRKDVLGALHVLAATRKSSIYRRYGSGP